MQLDKVLQQWFTAMHYEGKPMTGPVIIEKLLVSLLMM
jgi:hypothetical protein